MRLKVKICNVQIIYFAVEAKSSSRYTKSVGNFKWVYFIFIIQRFMACLWPAYHFGINIRNKNDPVYMNL